MRFLDDDDRSPTENDQQHEPLAPLDEGDPAIRAAGELVEAFLASDQPAHVVATLGDELLWSFSRTPGPFGPWFDGLDDSERELAVQGHLRGMTMGGQLLVERLGDEGNDIHLEPQVAAALHLRAAPSAMTVLRTTEEGPAWIVLRHTHGVWVSEVVTWEGYHEIALVRTADAVCSLVLEFLQVSDATPALDGEVALTVEELASDPARATLGDTPYLVANLFTGLPESTRETRMVLHVGEKGAALAEVRGSQLVYRGTDAARLRQVLTHHLEAWVSER